MLTPIEVLIIIYSKYTFKYLFSLSFILFIYFYLTGALQILSYWIHTIIPGLCSFLPFDSSFPSSVCF